jgi:Anti-sigma factor NepR
MPEKRPAGPRKRAAKTEAPGAAPPRGASDGVKQYIAGQLKAMYDEVVAQPIPERLLKLLDGLDSDGKNKES